MIVSKKPQKKRDLYLADYLGSWRKKSLGEIEDIYLFIQSNEILWVATFLQTFGQVIRATLAFFLSGTYNNSTSWSFKFSVSLAS